MDQKKNEEELDRRIDEITKHPERVISWEEVKAKMKPRDLTFPLKFSLLRKLKHYKLFSGMKI